MRHLSPMKCCCSLLTPRLAIALALFVLTATATSLLYGQVNRPESSKLESAHSNQSSKVQPFDRLIGLSADGSKGALYRHRKEIAVVDLTNGRIEQILPLTAEQLSAFGALENGPSKKNKIKAFFTSDQRVVWIFSAPDPGRMLPNQALLPAEMKAIMGIGTAPTAFLGKWDLRTSELVDQVAFKNRVIVDCEFISGPKVEEFYLVERETSKGEYVRELKTNLEEFTYYLVAYDAQCKSKLREQQLRIFQEDGSLLSVGGYLVLRYDPEMSFIETSSLLSILDIQQDSLGSNYPEIIFDSNDAYLYSPDFRWTESGEDQSEYGLPFSQRLKLTKLDLRKKTQSPSIYLSTLFKWANPQISTVTKANNPADKSRSLQEWSQVWRNQPKVMKLPQSQGIWLIRTDSNTALPRSIGYFQRLDGSKKDSVEFDGRYLGGCAQGIILSTGIWRPNNSTFTAYSEEAALVTRPQAKEIGDQSPTLLVGASKETLLVWSSDKLVSASENGNVVATWNEEQLRGTIGVEGIGISRPERIVSSYIDEQDCWIVAIPRTPKNAAAATETITNKLVEVYGSARLEYSRDYPEKPNLSALARELTIAMTHCTGDDWSIVQLDSDGSAKLLKVIHNSIQVLISTQQKFPVLTEVSASPRTTTIHRLASGEWESKSIIQNDRESDSTLIVQFLIKEWITAMQNATHKLPRELQNKLDVQTAYAVMTPSARYATKASPHGIYVASTDAAAVEPGELRLVSLEQDELTNRSITFNEVFATKFRGAFERTEDNTGRAASFWFNSMSSPLAVAMASNSDHIGAVSMNLEELNHTQDVAKSIYLDLRHAGSINKRLRHIPLGKHLQSGELIKSIELSATAEFVALKTELNKENQVRVIQLNTNKLVTTSTGDNPVVFTANGRVVLGNRIASLDKLTAEGDSAFQPLFR